MAKVTDAYSGRKIRNTRRIYSDLVGGKAHYSVLVVGGDGERVGRGIVKPRYSCGGGITHFQRLRVRSACYGVGYPISDDIITGAWVPSHRNGCGGFGQEWCREKRE